MTIGTVSIIVGVILLVLLKITFKDKGFHGVDHDKLFEEDLDFDSTWSTLLSNTHHSDDE